MAGARQAQKALTRRKIIDAAYGLYALQGFGATTQAVARQAGIAHGSVFAHFPTAEQLQLCVLDQFAREVGEALHGMSAAGEGVAGLLRAHLNILQPYESFYRHMLAELARLPEGARTVLIALQSVLAGHLSPALRREAKPIPLHMLLNTWLGLVHYYLQNGDCFAPGGSVLEKCGDELVDSFMALIAK